eukprot:7912282-Heterocapsa_arctica.AAC.1
MNGKTLFMTALKEPDNKHGIHVPRTDQTTKESNEEWMSILVDNCYQKLVQKDQMKAGALRTILAHG